MMKVAVPTRDERVDDHFGHCDHYTIFTIEDNKVVLELEDDAASVNWGGNWRMPTKEEQDELRDSCEWVWTTQKGVSGCQVIGPNGNSIFLPAAGFMSYGRLTCYGDVPDGLVSDGSLGYYWTSSCSCIFMGDEACILSFYIDGYYPEGFILGNLILIDFGEQSGQFDIS